MNDFSGIIERMNELGIELVSPESQRDPEIIIPEMYSKFWESNPLHCKTSADGNDWYKFDLLGIVAPYEPVLAAMAQLLRKSIKSGEDRWLFNPENGDFVTTLIRRAKFFVQRHVDMLNGMIPFPVDENGEPMDVPDTDCPIEEITEHIANLQGLSKIAELIVRQAWVEEGIKKSCHFDGYFTHDTVTAIYPLQRTAISFTLNEIIYPALSQILLVFLIKDRISELSSICGCKIRDGISLKKRNENVANCYEMKSPKHYSQKYNAWLESVKPLVL